MSIEDKAEIEVTETPVEEVVLETPAEQEPGADEAADVVTVTIEGESPPPEEVEAEDDKPWVRDLRKQHRENNKRLRELEAENERLKAQNAPPVEKPVLGEMPRLSDFDYDEDQHRDAMASWFERKQAVDAEKRKADAEKEEQQKAWQGKLAAYGSAKAELKVPDIEEAEAVVTSTLNVNQQAVLIQYFAPATAATLVAAIGSSPATAKRLAAITDPILFALAAKDLEAKVKVTTRTPPRPETKVTTSGRVSSGDQTLERLRAAADKTGDRTAVVQYLRQQKAR